MDEWKQVGRQERREDGKEGGREVGRQLQHFSTSLAITE